MKSTKICTIVCHNITLGQGYLSVADKIIRSARSEADRWLAHQPSALARAQNTAAKQTAGKERKGLSSSSSLYSRSPYSISSLSITCTNSPYVRALSFHSPVHESLAQHEWCESLFIGGESLTARRPLFTQRERDLRTC